MSYTVTGGNNGASVYLTEQAHGGITFLTVDVSLPTPSIPEPIRVQWSFPASGCVCTWNPAHHDANLGTDWAPVTMNSRLASWLPLQVLLASENRNKLLIAVSDVDTPVRIQTGICEEDATFACTVELFTLPTNPTTHYSAVIRLDTRDIPFYDAVYDTVSWWETECGYVSAPVPECAKLPMDSLWYSFHQMLDKDEILKECRASKALGMESVIIDDGWQTDDNNRGYAYCGDWEPTEKKMGNMAELSDELHNLGMKVILWFSVPFVGLYAKQYSAFQGMLLDGGGNGDNAFSLDPRYKKVREYLVGIYEHAVRDWHLDGLKLDFIDNFALRGKSLEYDSARDFQSLEEAIHALMYEVYQKLRALNPDILIEFRQSYVGPSIRKYGNMLRAGDCPCDIRRNRASVINLRLTSGNTAVHSDMIMWNVADTVENAALQFVNILYSVPQISMRIDKLPEKQRKMLQFYIHFWKTWREVLLDGKLTAEHPECGYTSACSTLGDKAVATVYTNPVVSVSAAETVIVNASGQPYILVQNAMGKTYSVVNCMGEPMDEGAVCSQLAQISVPTAGIVYLR